MTLTIEGLPPEMTHQRWEWERSNERIASWVRSDGKVYVAPKINMAAIDGNGDHYPGVPGATIDSSTDAKVIEFLRNIQHSYIESRGYSNGYGIGIDIRGDAWEIRGFDFKCAANAQHNDHIVAVFLILGSSQEPSEAMMNTARLVHAETARRAGRALTPWTPTSGFWISGHNDLRKYPPRLGRGTPTSCCGQPLYAKLHTKPVGDGGLLHPRELPPPPAPPKEANPMFICRHTGTDEYHVGDHLLRRFEASPQQLIASYQGTGVPLIDKGSRKPVKKLSDVTEFDAKFLGVDIGLLRK